ncbi:hypothetical protein [Paenibacillus silviterrae]|uniref:hypothetical protein n=1 Tax=Paenibacillus silviterrae TaxID=3242194 RepID=UPI0025436184|nr:hypothetical protein [Paenibacillus chinjuensis]
MNKFVFYIVASVVCILTPFLGLLYGLWDSHQPKIGPVGDGKAIYPTLPQLIPLICCFLTGVLNLPIAIMRYRQNKKNQEDNNN